ncbi:DNA polymerase delta catalytic subunit [Psilocybe cubensis]|uniref:DNA polymerase delta catalytic subunit n=1 Tax=Psilocybe cubensis TaxID=181762 RepID=A0ACB8GYA7_PSICU|nr:DNA polymerase delta catalytic subunit [Psilocybe cubensis]KAH9480606.1 DNA polymerase delta catalytic subunit [Psilocybe cubensis]
MSWLKFVSNKYDIVPETEKISTCQLEVVLQYNDEHILLCSPRDKEELFAPLRILSYDIETHVPADGTFPSATKDPVLQIGNMVTTHGSHEPTIRAIFTLGTCSPINGAEVRSFKTEAEMLLAWSQFVNEVDPDIITGYNITKFDTPYLLNRATALSLPKFAHLGRVKSWRQTLPYPFMKVEEFSQCPGYNGRLLLDVFQHIREGNYSDFQGPGKSKLNYVAQVALWDQKEDLPYKQIPILQAGTANDRRTLAVESTKAKEAHVSLNSKRKKPFLKDLSRDCRKALREDYIIPDSKLSSLLDQR